VNDKRVIATTASQNIESFVAGDDVVTRATIDRVVTTFSGQFVVTIVPGYTIVAVTT
jgi:hypothetical protein